MSRTGDKRYRKAAKRCKNSAETCWICGQPIDPTLKFPHPMSFTADHITPIALGGDNLGPLAPAHKHCNESRGTKTIIQHTNHLRNW